MSRSKMDEAIRPKLDDLTLALVYAKACRKQLGRTKKRMHRYRTQRDLARREAARLRGERDAAREWIASAVREG